MCKKADPYDVDTWTRRSPRLWKKTDVHAKEGSLKDMTNHKYIVSNDSTIRKKKNTQTAKSSWNSTKKRINIPKQSRTKTMKGQRGVQKRWKETWFWEMWRILGCYVECRLGKMISIISKTELKQNSIIIKHRMGLLQR